MGPGAEGSQHSPHTRLTSWLWASTSLGRFLICKSPEPFLTGLLGECKELDAYGESWHRVIMMA